MTPQERQVLEDAEAQAFESSQIESGDESTGVPKPPVIESTETILEAGVFGFEFAGQPTATAEPGASTPPPDDDETGACCFPNLSCSVTTELDCADQEGIYMGDGTDCDPNPCVDCGENEVTLCKCGADDCGGSGRKWLTVTFVETWSVTNEESGTCGGTCSSSGSTTQIEEYDPFTCDSSTTSCSGTLTRFCENADPQQDDCTWELSGGGCDAEPSPACNGNFFFLCCSHVIDTSTCEGGGLISHLNRECDTADGELDDYTTVSDEYTTEMLIDNTLAKFAADFGDCPEGCVVTYELNEDESCCTARCELDHP